MSHPAKKLCDRAARDLANKGDGASIAGVMLDVRGQKAFGFSMAEATTQDMLIMAVALLRSLEETTAQGALTCAGCAADHARVAIALAALRSDKGALKGHLH